MPRTFFLFYLLVLLAETNATDYTFAMLSILIRLITILVIFVAPLLLLYGFLRGTLDTIRLKRHALFISLAFTGQTGNATNPMEILQNLGNVFLSIALIILPFTVMLLIWKMFTKVVRL
jgi:uncharacterized membrane protein